MSVLGHDERIQRALNEVKKRMLEERYGACFGGSSDPLPPEVERRWLDSIEEFEEKYRNAETVTVRDFVGNPHVRLLGEISPDELPRELDRLIMILDENDVCVEFPEHISEQEKYRSLTEDLLNEEMENVRIEGMMHVFCYGEVDPSDEPGDVPPSE